MTTPARTAIVLVNPTARRVISLRALEAAGKAVLPRGWRVRLETPGSAADARERAERYTRAGVDAVVACGGDGTLRAVVHGVRAAGEDARTAVGIIPAGTANVWAAEAGVPRDPVRALALLAEGDRRRVDVGVARIGQGEPVRFLLLCSVGLDAAVVEAAEAHPRWKRRLGRLAYGAPALAVFGAWRPVAARITLDGDILAGEAIHTPRLLLAVAANIRRYAGVVPLVRSSALDDGLLEVTVFEERESEGIRALPSRIALALQALRGRLDERAVRGVTHRQAATLTITPARALPVEVDGDSIGRCGPDTPLHITVEQRALTMIFGTP